MSDKKKFKEVKKELIKRADFLLSDGWKIEEALTEAGRPLGLTYLSALSIFLERSEENERGECGDGDNQ